MNRDESTENLPHNAAERLAELTGRPVEEFSADEYETPDFEDQEVLEPDE